MMVDIDELKRLNGKCVNSENINQFSRSLADVASHLHNEIETLRQQEIESDQLRGRLTSILTRTANELKGQPEPLHMHSWHDLPERAAYAVKAAADAICHAVALEQEIETLRARVKELEQVGNICDCGSPIVHTKNKCGWLLKERREEE